MIDFLQSETFRFVLQLIGGTMVVIGVLGFIWFTLSAIWVCLIEGRFEFRLGESASTDLYLLNKSKYGSTMKGSEHVNRSTYRWPFKRKLLVAYQLPFDKGILAIVIGKLGESEYRMEQDPRTQGL